MIIADRCAQAGILAAVMRGKKRVPGMCWGVLLCASGAVSAQLPEGAPLPQAYDVAVATMVDNMFADDAKEGIGAFLGKRMPEWP